jgi:hypothetical protein
MGWVCRVLASASLFLLSVETIAGPLVVNMNLHGHHPYFEGRRYFQDRSGRIEAAPAHLFYFSREELRRGVARRDAQLASDLRNLDADVVVMQEVVSGWGETQKSCSSFEQQNSALSLAQAWGFEADLAPACRGNLGWFTGIDSFRDKRIVRRGRGGFEVVMDFDTNPYPAGLVVEGFAVMARAPWRLRENISWTIPAGPDKFFFQSVELYSETDSDSWKLVVNVHGTHKIAHFEAAVAVREWMQLYLREHPLRAQLSGVLISGDFNAKLSEASMVPWLVEDPSKLNRAALAQSLKELNENTLYKPWASIWPVSWAWSRIQNALDQLERVRGGEWNAFSDALTTTRAEGRCDASASKGVLAGCEDPYGIDHILIDAGQTVRNAFVLYPGVSEENTLQRPSDHPGIVVDFQ